MRGTLWQWGQTAWAMSSRHGQDQRFLTSEVPSLLALCHLRQHCYSKTPWPLPAPLGHLDVWKGSTDGPPPAWAQRQGSPLWHQPPLPCLIFKASISWQKAPILFIQNLVEDLFESQELMISQPNDFDGVLCSLGVHRPQNLMLFFGMWGFSHFVFFFHQKWAVIVSIAL